MSLKLEMDESVKIPVLDCSEIEGCLEDIQDTEGFKAFAQKLGDGIKNIGFVYLANHETPAETVDQFHSKAREFFLLPSEVKRKYRKPDAVENFFGYNAASDEKAGEVEKQNNGEAPDEPRECFDISGIDAYDETKFPQEVSGFKKSVDDFRSTFSLLTKKLCKALALYLNLDDKNLFLNNHRFLDDTSIFSHTTIRTNYYMPIYQIEDADQPRTEIDDKPILRMGEHCDFGSFSFLIQDDAGGLEAKMSDGQWIPVPPIENAIVLNAGLMIEFWSGGILPATFHRVRAIGTKQLSQCRQSCGFFVQPDGTSRCTPVVPIKKEGWVCAYPFDETETHFEYFRERVRQMTGY